MIKINVCQAKNEFLDRVVIAAFDEANMTITITDSASCELCVLSANGNLNATNAKILIAPDSKKIPELSVSEVISYGLCCKNTLTVSSCIDSNLVISLQRKILTLGGNWIEEQDFSVKLSDPDEPEIVLAAVACLLACDVPISLISSLPF